MAPDHIVAVWYVGLFIFAINGCLWMGHRNEVRAHRAAMEKAERVILRRLRKR